MYLQKLRQQTKLPEFIIVCIFSLISLFTILFHESWRDEAQSWLIARDNIDLFAMLNLTNNQGHPSFWYLVLFPLSHLGLPYFVQNIANFSFMLGAVVLILFKSPLPRKINLLIPFSYFMLYEYNILARNYSVIIFFLVAIAVFYKHRFEKPAIYTLLLVLLGNTHIDGLITSLVLSFVYALEIGMNKWKLKQELPLTQFLSALLIFIVGTLITLLQILPSADLSPSLTQWSFSKPIGVIWRNIGNILINTFVPLSFPSINFWNNIILKNTAGYIIGYLIFLITIVFLIKKPIPLLFYFGSAMGIITFSIVKYMGTLRHHGVIFVLFFIAIWISYEYETINLNSYIPKSFTCIITNLSKKINKMKILSQKKFTYQRSLSVFLGILLVLQILAASIAVFYEVGNDFSASQSVAHYLVEQKYFNDDTFIATYPCTSGSAILPYLPDPHSQFYYLEFEEFHSYVSWTVQWSESRYLSTNQIINRMDKVINFTNYSTYLLLLVSQNNDTNFTSRYTLINSFTNTIVQDESFYIYKLN